MITNGILIGIFHFLIYFIGKMLKKKSQYNEWDFLYLGVFIFELLIWDMLLQPLILISLSRFKNIKALPDIFIE